MGLDSSIQSLIYKRNCKQNFNVRLLVIFLINYSIFPKIAWAGEVFSCNDYCAKIFKNYHLKTFEQQIEFEKYYNLDGFVTNFKKPYPTIFFDKNFVESNEIFMNLCSFKYDLIFNFDIWDSELDSAMFKSPKFTQNIWQNKLQNMRQIMDFFWIKPITFGQNINYLNSNQKKILSINELKSRLIILLLQKQIIEFEKIQIGGFDSLAFDHQIKSFFDELGVDGSKEIGYLMASSQSELKGFVNQYFKNLGSFNYQIKLLLEKITILQKILSTIDEKILIKRSWPEKNFGDRDQLFNLEKQKFYLIFKIHLTKNEILILNFRRQILTGKEIKKIAQKILNYHQNRIEIISK